MFNRTPKNNYGDDNQSTDFGNNTKSQTPKKSKKRHLIAKIIGVSATATAATGATAVLGTYGAWQYAKQQYKLRRLHTPAFSGVFTPQRFTGKVHKVGEYLTFVTDGKTYALNDPLLRIQSLYQSNKTPTEKNDGKQIKLMDKVHCDEISIIAELSDKGHYGYLGHLDYQLTVIETADHQMAF